MSTKIKKLNPNKPNFFLARLEASGTDRIFFNKLAQLSSNFPGIELDLHNPLEYSYLKQRKTIIERQKSEKQLKRFGSAICAPKGQISENGLFAPPHVKFFIFAAKPQKEILKVSYSETPPNPAHYAVWVKDGKIFKYVDGQWIDKDPINNSRKEITPDFVKVFRKRAKAKFLTEIYRPALVELDSSLKKKYIDSGNCSHTINQKENKLTSLYCKQRWCMVCNRIRTAQLINGYYPELKKLKDPFFITLTTANVEKIYLPEMLEIYQRIFRKIYKDYCNKRSNLKRSISRLKRKIKTVCKKNNLETYIELDLQLDKLLHELEKYDPIRGIKKIECTYNSKEDTYHPHLHVILNDKFQAQFFLDSWFREFKALEVLDPIFKIDTQGQDIRPLDPETGIMEIFKYFTKVITKVECVNENGELAKEGFIFIHALDTIFQSMAGRRVFEALGIRQIKEDPQTEVAEIYEDIALEKRLWVWDYSDWYSSGQNLSYYKPSESFKELLKKVIY